MERFSPVQLIISESKDTKLPTTSTEKYIVGTSAIQKFKRSKENEKSLRQFGIMKNKYLY